MTSKDSEPLFFLYGDGRVGVHGTAVSIEGAGLVITGPSGSGKSGLAAQLLAFGADLVCDDIVILEARPEGVMATAPPGAPSAIELRGLGIAPIRTRTPVPVAAILSLGPSMGRLPETTFLRILDRDLRHASHPHTMDLAAKLLVWMQGFRDGGDAT